MTEAEFKALMKQRGIRDETAQNAWEAFGDDLLSLDEQGVDAYFHVAVGRLKRFKEKRDE